MLFLSLLGVLFIASGCLNEIQGQKITVQKRIGEANFFEEFKEITQKKQVETAIDIVESADWKNVKVDPARYADYQFQFPFKNSSSEDKIASYLLWISLNGENLEIVTENNRCARLTKQDSAEFYEILLAEKLVE